MTSMVIQADKRKIAILTYFKKEKNYIGVAIAFYAFLAILLFRFYQYKLYPDIISYISIARDYLDGDFYNAINGYFAPAYSWLLIPFLFMGLPQLISAKILSILIGLLALLAVNKISFQIDTNNIRHLILFTSVPIVLYFAFFLNTPDLLLVLLLLFYLDALLNPDYMEKKSRGIIVGALGAISYFAKHYAFPFFISHFILINCIYYFRNRHSGKKKILLWNFLGGMLVFILVSGVWIGLISHKYHKFTISTSASYVYALMRPGSQGHPVGYSGFFKPSNENAVSAWEDPSKIEVKKWNPIQSLEFLKHQVKLSLSYIRRIMIYTGFFSALSFGIIFGTILFLTLRGRNFLYDKNFLFLTTLLLYDSGYILILPVERYLWLNSILVLLLGGSLLKQLFQYSFFQGIRKKLTIIFFVASFLIHPTYILLLEANRGKDLYDLSQTLKNRYNIHGNIASHSNYKRPLFLSFLLNLRYFGTARKGIKCNELNDDLKNNNIDYYFVWDNSFDEFDDLAAQCQNMFGFNEITKGEIPELRIYDIKSLP